MASIVQQTVSLSLCKIVSMIMIPNSCLKKKKKNHENEIINFLFGVGHIFREINSICFKNIYSNPQINLNLQQTIVGINLDFFGCILPKTA